MRTNFVVAAASLCIGLALTTAADDDVGSSAWAGTKAAGSHVLEFLDGRLEIGGRITEFSLDTTVSPGTDRDTPGSTFLGNLTRIEEVQDSSPNLFINILPIPYVGLQLTWDGVEAQTWNWNTGQSDGNVEASGPMLSLLVQYPNETRFTPYATIGKTMWDAEFNEAPWWEYGFGSPEHYAASGSPGGPVSGMRRFIETDMNDGTAMSVGVAIRILETLSVDLTYRTVSCDVDASYYRTQGPETTLRRTGNFPLDHSSYGLGLKYVF